MGAFPNAKFEKDTIPVKRTKGDLIFDDFYEFEVKYLIKEEMARTSEDILFRRTKLGINLPKEARDKLEIILKRHL